MNKTRLSLGLVNLFGGLGYLSGLSLWTWVGAIFMPLLLSNDSIKQLFISPATNTGEASGAIMSSPPSWVMTIFAILVTIIIVGITVFILIKLPVTVSRIGKTTTTKIASRAVPVLAQNQPISRAETQHLTASLIKIIKLSLILMPVGLTLLGLILPLPLQFELILFVSCLLAALSLTFFGLQYILARLLNIDSDKLV